MPAPCLFSRALLRKPSFLSVTLSFHLLGIISSEDLDQEASGDY